MSLTGVRAWKEVGLGPEERIDRFFNLIDHAVDNGISLDSLYNRKHLKDFLLYTLHHSSEFNKSSSSTPTKDQKMPNLTLTNNQGSLLVVGDPGFCVVEIQPKATKNVTVTEEQLRLLTPHLDRLKDATWLTYAVDAAPVPVETKPVEPPPVTTPIAPPVVTEPKNDDPPPESDPLKGDDVGDKEEKKEDAA